MQTNAYKLLGILLSHAPTSKEQGFMSARYNEITFQIARDFETNHELELEKAMASMLNNGLQHGNWPWTI